MAIGPTCPNLEIGVLNVWSRRENQWLAEAGTNLLLLEEIYDVDKDPDDDFLHPLSPHPPHLGGFCGRRPEGRRE